MQKVSIIGGNGFLGKNFVTYFSSLEYQVISIDHNINPIQTGSANLTKKQVDVQDIDALLEATQESNIVIWLVHATVPSSSHNNCTEDFHLNISPLIKFLENSIQLKNLKKFIYISSGGTIYGNPTIYKPIVESHEKIPISAYGLSKLIAEEYITFLTKNKLFESIILRPSNIYGPFQNLVKPQGIIGYAFKSIKEKQPLTIYNGGKVVRDFVFIKDIAEAIQLVIEGEVSPGITESYNLGSSKGYAIYEILQMIEAISKEKLLIENKTARSFDCDYNVLDITKFNTKYKWTPRITMADGLLDVWNWINTSTT